MGAYVCKRVRQTERERETKMTQKERIMKVCLFGLKLFVSENTTRRKDAGEILL